jgi:ABC-type branched-subunit amino acid transport system ATPase component
MASISVRTGESLGVIGPNGAGKSTFINLISGALAPSGGRIVLFGEDITTHSADARTRRGIGRTHQIPRPFARMSVWENLALAARHARGAHDMRSVRENCRSILERTGLADVAERAAGALPLLRRKRLELARALALRPRLLLLDEIGAGLIDSETRALIELIQALRAEVGHRADRARDGRDHCLLRAPPCWPQGACWWWADAPGVRPASGRRVPGHHRRRPARALRHRGSARRQPRRARRCSKSAVSR